MEILACALCGGKMRVISVIDEGPVATKILDHLGLPSAPPVRAPARDPPDPELFVRDEDNHIKWKRWDAGSGWYAWWISVATDECISSSPAVSTWPGGRDDGKFTGPKGRKP